MFKYNRPVIGAKSQRIKKETEAMFTREVVCCHKCGATQTTLRKIPLRGKIVYYCETCIKKAMKENKDVRED